MLAVVGLWKDREDIGDSTEYVREVRAGDRFKRLTDSPDERTPIRVNRE